MISEAERSNFLRQCWRTGHWKDGVGTLLLPLRMSLYGLRRGAVRRNKQNGNGAAHAVAEIQAPTLSSNIHRIFCDRPAAPEIPANLDSIFAEAEAQIRGTFRLAGGHCALLSRSAIESSADPEDAHAYHRLYWALRYAEAASFGHAKSGKALIRELTEWLVSRWELSSAIAAWPYTTAERIGSLTATLFWIDRSRNSELLTLIPAIKQQIWKDGVRLSTNIEYGLGVHNHLLNDARGLYLAGAALESECEEAAQWRKQAFDIWGEFFPKLVFADGTFAEQSSHYHVLLCRTALEYWLACRNENRSLPAGFEPRLRAMFELANELLRPDGSMARFGHNSPDRTISDLWGLLAGAHHYGLLKQSPRHREVTPLTLFYCGAYPKMSETVRSSALRLFPDGGFAMLRLNARNAEITTHGDLRDAVGTHGDAGRGSYELWWNGHVLVREPGSYFSPSDKHAEIYQSAAAQNVTTLDGLSPAITKKDARFLPKWYPPQGAEWKQLDSSSVQFRCDSFSRLQPGIVVSRTWRVTEPDTFTFEEHIEGSRRVDFESRICLGDANWAASEQVGGKVAKTLNWRDEDGSSAQMTIDAPSTMNLTEQPCSFLPEYGVEKQGRMLLLAGAQQLPFSWRVEWKLREAA